MCIPSEDESEWNNESEWNKHPHWEWDREWRCASPGMGMCLTENGDLPHREWGCASLEMHILTGNAYPHRECISSPGMHIVYTGCGHKNYLFAIKKKYSCNTFTKDLLNGWGCKN